MDIGSHFLPENRRRLVLRRGRERLGSSRHPWIFSGAIEGEEGPEDAAIADLVDRHGRRLASGFHSRHSQIRLRVVAGEDEDLTPDLIRARIATAVRRRDALLSDSTDALRLVHSEGDDLSGLVVDRYGDTLVVEITSAGLDALRELAVEALEQSFPLEGIVFHNDLAARRLEKLPLEESVTGDPSRELTVMENGLRFVVRPGAGQKTGFFLDQRENRALARTISRDRRVLNLFSYSGGFGVNAAAGGASVVEEVDVSAPAIEAAGENHRINPSGADVRLVVADAFSWTRERLSGGERYDLVVSDPPAFAKTRGDVDRAARGYKDINLQAMKLLEPGGELLTFSCSGHISLDLFQKIVYSAALDSGRRASFVRRLGAGADHPVSLFAPEGEYLKGLWVRVE
ncbi:MAG: class I SAM-dependent rRNA methyltransferase [Thermoanaerobaculia bacterium]